MSWIFGAYGYDVIIYGLYLKRTQLLCVIWRYCLWVAYPCLSRSAVVFIRSICVEFVTCANLKCMCFHIHSFNLNLRYNYGHNQASRHTHAHAQCSHASVGLAQAHPNYHIICDNIILQNIVGSISLQMSRGKIFNTHNVSTNVIFFRCYIILLFFRFLPPCFLYLGPVNIFVFHSQ